MRRTALALALAAGVLPATALLPATAEAFSTRVHIVIANKVREALVDAGDGTIALRFSGESVVLDTEDFEAIRDNPLAFRAGAVGPDNMVFPGMTDPSHALGQRPYEQCELLYQEAATSEERAYALGCFLHGTTDAIAHHYVNYMTGETFTLTPITSARQQSLDNVVRHILAESQIQKAAFALDPDAFAASKLLHTIPVGFVLRSYLDTSHPLWQMMAAHAKAEYDKAVAENPGAGLQTIVASLDIAPADHLVLAPVYLASVDDSIEATRLDLEAQIAVMQDHGSPEGSQLLVTPGPDGKLGTKDDETDCAFTCPNLFAKYFTYAGLLAPRYNAQNQELPSAFVKVTDELRAELYEFLPAYMQTVQNLSSALNETPSDMDTEFGLGKDEVKALFAPMNAWADKITTIDYDTLVYAVVPDWIIELDTLMQSVGLDVDIAAILEAVFQPIVQPIKDAIQQAFIAQAQVFIEQLVAEIEAKKEPIYAEYDARLAAAAPPGLGGTALDNFYESGLFGHAFNIAAATFANHEAILPVGDDPIGVGPASFDASYTPAWMQAGICDHLQPAIFPLGIDVRGELSVRKGGTDYPAQVDDDAPVECHEGSLSAFADPATIAACVLVKLDALLEDPVGSVSRAYPPLFAENPASCEKIVVPGLPEPPPDPGTTGGETDTGGSGTAGTAGTTGDTDSAGTAGSAGSAGTGVDAATATAGADGGGDEGCGCTSTGGQGPGALALSLLPLLALRRRRRALAGLALAPALGLTACAGDDAGTATDSTTGASTSSTSGASASSTSSDPTTSAGETDATTSDGTSTTSASSSTSGSDTDPTTGTTGGPGAGELLDALNGTVWHGLQSRGGKERAYELRFDADSLLWSEVRNPFGPARLREMRAFNVEGDGMTAHSTVIQPPGWPIHPENGRKDDWTLEVLDGAPRILRTTRDGVVEEFEEGPWPAPQDGLTATVRVFKVGGVIDKAFCDSGLNGFDYINLFKFARGMSDEIVATDVVAGAKLDPWTDPSQNNQFSVNDVHGFDQLGGTELTDTFNFFVTYTGTVGHPGGTLKMREGDDSVEDALWVFLADKVGSENENDLFLEVQGFAWPDKTADAPSASFPAGDLPFEAILVRCTEAIKDVDVDIDLGGGWKSVGDAPTKPVVNDDLFPPAL